MDIIHNKVILVVDDNLPDGTAHAVEKMTVNYPSRLHILDRPEKRGRTTTFLQGFTCGIERGYDAMLTMDADFSHDPKYIPLLLEKTIKSDVVGSRWNTPHKVNIQRAGILAVILVNFFISKIFYLEGENDKEQ